MTFKLNYLLIILLLAIPFTTDAKSGATGFVEYSALKVEDGLSQISVLDIHKDSRGYIWFATRNGLNRYDGNSFAVYTKNESLPFGLTDNHINSIDEDNDGNLWIGTNHGLTRLDPSTQQTKLYVDSLPFKVFDQGVRAVLCTSEGKTIIGTPNGLIVYDGNDRFSSANKALDGMTIDNLDIMRDGRILVATTTAGLYILNPDLSINKHFTAHDGALPTDNVQVAYEDSKGTVWLGNSSDGMISLNPTTGEVRTFNQSNSDLPSNSVRCFIDDGTTLFIGTGEGICSLRFDDESRQIDFEDNNLSNFSVYSLLLDDNATRWVGTYSGGVNYYNAINDRFTFHQPQPNSDYLGVFGATAYNPDNKKLYIATEGHGLLEYDPDSGKYKYHNISPSEHQQSVNIIKSVTYHEGKIWCGTASGEVFIFDPATSKHTPYFKTGKCSIYAIVHAADGAVWLGTSNSNYGVIKVRDGKIEQDKFTDLKQPMASTRVLQEIKPNVFLIGTRRHGLLKYDHNRDLITQLGEDCANTGSYITAVVKDNTGYGYWLGTFDNGLYYFNPTTSSMTRDNNLYKAASDEIYQIVCGEDGALWICTGDGITKYNHDRGEIVNYRRPTDIRIQEFSPHSGMQMPDGEIVVSGNNGFITFDPAHLLTNDFIPPIVFTSLHVNNNLITPAQSGSILKHSIDATDRIVLDYKHNNISISYAALTYIHPDQNRYAYRLRGADDDWVEVGNRREANYANLAPGKYTFEVKAANSDGVWSDEIRSIDIEITPPIWQTWYAYLFYVLAIGCVIALVMYYIFKKKELERSLSYEQLKQQQTEEFHQSKIRMFTNFSHELRTPLTLIVSPLQELLKRDDLSQSARNKVNLIYNNAQRLLLLVNQLMDLHKNEAGKMQLKITKDDIVPFMQEMYTAFNQLAVNRSITFDYECRDERISAWFDKSLLEKVVFNILSNAFKYTPEGGKVRMEMKRIANGDPHIPSPHPHLPDVADGVKLVHLSVTDSDRGIPEEELKNIFTPFYQADDAQSKTVIGTGIGLSLTKSIVGLHHGIIWAENNEDGAGASFHVVLPIEKSVYSDDEIDKDTEHRVVMDVIPPSDKIGSRTDAPRYSVLLVEDNPEVRAYVKECLEPYYNVIEADNGQKAFDLAVDKYPDIIVSDIMMPVKDGLELCAMIKEDLRTGHIPVILITARSMVMQIKEGFATGADDYIVKPFNMDVLLYRIRNILSAREKLKNLYGKQFSPKSLGIEIVKDSDRFTQRFFDVIEKNIANPDLNIDMICKEIGFSRANLYRKLKTVTTLSPMELIRNKRLEVAAKLLLESDYSVSEISTYVGFNSHAYFTNCFKSVYGMSPTEFVESKKVAVEANQ